MYPPPLIATSKDPITHRATILGDSIEEAAVALCSDLDLVGALEEQSVLQVAGLRVHVSHAVLAVVGDVLGSFSGHQPQEGQLNGNVSWVGSLTTIFELPWEMEGRREQGIG